MPSGKKGNWLLNSGRGRDFFAGLCIPPSGEAPHLVSLVRLFQGTYFYLRSSWTVPFLIDSSWTRSYPSDMFIIFWDQEFSLSFSSSREFLIMVFPPMSHHGHWTFGAGTGRWCLKLCHMVCVLQGHKILDLPPFCSESATTSLFGPEIQLGMFDCFSCFTSLPE